MGQSAYLLQKKTITVNGRIRAKDSKELHRIKDAMKRSFYVPNQRLERKRSDGKAMYTLAHLTGLQFESGREIINYQPYVATFLTLEPFWYGKKKHEEVFLGQGQEVQGTLVYDEGSYECLPLIYIDVKKASDTNTVSITIGGQTITLNEPIQSGDTIIIDGKTRDVSLNGNGGRDYVGTFPTLRLGENPFSLTANGTRTADIYMQWEDTYV